MIIVDMRTRPPLETWVTKAQYRQGNVYYPTRVGFTRPPSAEQRSSPMLVKELVIPDGASRSPLRAGTTAIRNPKNQRHS